MTSTSAKVASSWKQFGRTIDSAQQHDLDQHADHADDESGRDDAAPKAEGAANARGKSVGNVGPEHIQGPVRNIDDAGDAENKRQAGRDEKQTRCG